VSEAETRIRETGLLENTPSHILDESILEAENCEILMKKEG
jgi:hypothetical protein